MLVLVGIQVKPYVKCSEKSSVRGSSASFFIASYRILKYVFCSEKSKGDYLAPNGFPVVASTMFNGESKNQQCRWNVRDR